MNSVAQTILRTLVYADVFDYPLTDREIWKFLISEKKVSIEKIHEELKQGNLSVDSEGKYFFLKGKNKVVETRKIREKWNNQKFKIARRVASWLRMIPWVKMVAVTGALSMNNAKKGDDIDFFFITDTNRLWLSRGLIVFFLRFFGLYRRPQRIRDMICPNMFLDVKHLAVPEKERNLFSAHEVLQLVPLWDKKGIYDQFLKENQWVGKYLANWKK